MTTRMTAPPDVPTMAPITVNPRTMAAIMLLQGGKIEYFGTLKNKMSRVQCIECGTKIGPGRAGRKCKECLNQPLVLRNEST